jgi:ribosomal protein L24E
MKPGPYTCGHCGLGTGVINSSGWYHVHRDGSDYSFCSKHHLREWLRLGKDGVVVCEPPFKRYEPTQEEEDRMKM